MKTNVFSQTSIAISVLILQSLRLFRLFFYEAFLRDHQTATLIADYALWKHITSGSKLSRLYVYISTRIFLVTSVLQCVVVLYRNFSFRRDHSRALISKHRDSIRITIDISRSLNIRADQYVNVWISSISLWSFLQSHSFTIASWENKEEVTSLDLLIESRKDLTQKLYACVEYYREHFEKGTDKIVEKRVNTVVDYRKSQNTLYESVERKNRSIAVDSHEFQETLFEPIELKRLDRAEAYQRSLEKDVENITSSKFDYECYEGEPQRSDFRLAIVSEPHGTSISVDDYEKILMIVTKFDIVAQLSYLKELIREFNNYQVRTREIRLIWQLQSFDKSLDSDSRWSVDWASDDRRSTSELIDRVLKEDIDTNNYMSTLNWTNEMYSSDWNQIFHIEAYYKSKDLTQNSMTMSKHDRLIYKRETMNLSKLMNDQLIPRSADGKKFMLVTNKFEVRFFDNELILASVRKRTSARRTAKPCAITARQS